MAEYIDRDAAANIFEAPMWRGYAEPYTFEAHLAMVAVAKLIREEIGKIPAADVAPVVHGRWIGVDSSYWKPTHSTDIPVFRKTYRCSECGRRTAIAENYCPNCGARMDADTQERAGGK